MFFINFDNLLRYSLCSTSTMVPTSQQHPLSAKWTGSGDHFGFMNQPNAGYANFMVLVESLLPIIDANGGDADEVREDISNRAQEVFSNAIDVAMRSKMGLVGGDTKMKEEADELWAEIEPLLRIGRGDLFCFVTPL